MTSEVIARVTRGFYSAAMSDSFQWRGAIDRLSTLVCDSLSAESAVPAAHHCDVETDSPPSALQPVIDSARAGIYPDLWLEPWLNHKDVARLPSGLGGMCYSNPAHPTDAALVQYLAPLLASPERKALVNRCTLGLTPNPLAAIAPLLKKCTAPTRVVWGMRDGIFSSENPDYLAEQ